jgi:hypothetical protein
MPENEPESDTRMRIEIAQSKHTAYSIQTGNWIKRMETTAEERKAKLTWNKPCPDLPCICQGVASQEHSAH